MGACCLFLGNSINKNYLCLKGKDQAVMVGNGNGLLFHMTQPTRRSTIKAIACSKPTISEQ